MPSPWIAAAFAAFLVLSPAFAADPPKPAPSAASDWLDVALEATAREHERNGPRPTVGTRMLGIVVTCQFMQMEDGKSGFDPKLTCAVALQLPTFSATAGLAGLSRVLGGYHIQADHVAGLTLGRNVADAIWPMTNADIDGTAARK